MRARFQAALVGAVLLVGLAGAAAAQQPATTPPPVESAAPPTEAAPGAPAVDTTRPPLDVELETGG